MILAGVFLALAIGSQDLAVGGACLGLAAAVFLFVFYIHPDASDLAPTAPSSTNCWSAATPSMTICAT